MDRAATRHQFQTRLSAADGAGTPSPLQIGDIAWRSDGQTVRELHEHAPGLLARAKPTDRLGANEAAGDRVSVIKSGSHRSVFRIELPSGAVFLKHFKTSKLFDRLRNALVGTPAEREARAARRVAAAGIETIACAAVGVETRGLIAGDSFLVSHAIADVAPLDEVVRDPASTARRTPGFRRELARALGRICGQLHRAGLVHRDLHPANLLARMNSDSNREIQIRLTLIDLQGVRARRTRGFVFRRGARARWDLFGLFNFFRDATRADRCRFLHAYLREAGALHAGAGWIRGVVDVSREQHSSRTLLARQLETFCRNAARREQLRYDKKWQRSNRRLIVADSKGACCRGLAILGADQVLELRGNSEALFRPDRVRLWLRRTPQERTAIVDLWAAGEIVRCEARETTRALGWRDVLPRFRWSPARHAWEMSHALRRRGISTPRSLLYLETRSMSQVREVLVGERSGRHVSLANFLAHYFVNLSAEEKEAWIQRTARALAAELARMHEFSLVHSRISAADVGVVVNAGVCGVQIGGVDRVVRKRALTSPIVMNLLGQLHASVATFPELRRSHVLRFLKKYLGGRFAAEWKPTWRSIAAQPQVERTPTRLPSNTLRRRPARAAGLLLAAMFAFCGCQAIERPVTLPVKYEVKCKGEQLLILSNFKLKEDHELIRELTTLREQEATILALPLQRDPVVIYLFSNEPEYRKYMAVTYPKLPPRSAYFVGTPTELAVYTHWGQSVREDLRHEYTHGLLHSAMKRVPLWLDEGLAEYFEISGPQPGGINREYATKLSKLLAQGWQPDLKRLERLGDDAQMRRSDYQESWAWVHFMLHGSPETKRVLLAYLKDLRTIPDPKPISRRLAAECPDFQERSMAYMGRLATERQVAEAL
jgi:tRNA A-37 threonylcarbamoyl transferase component Bud32